MTSRVEAVHAAADNLRRALDDAGLHGAHVEPEERGRLGRIVVKLRTYDAVAVAAMINLDRAATT